MEKKETILHKIHTADKEQHGNDLLSVQELLVLDFFPHVFSNEC